MKHHYGWIIILLGACLIAATSCSLVTKPKVEVVAGDPPYHNQYLIVLKGRGEMEFINTYLPNSNVSNGIFLGKEDAVNLAKHFTSWQKVDHWNDSVEALIKTPKKPERETITIY